MGCQCCRMIKSYIYDPSVAVDVRKTDSAGSSLYQPHQLSGGGPGGSPPGNHGKQKQGFHNLAYSKSSDSTLKLEADNNHVNRRLHSAKEPLRLGGGPPAEVYIIQPDGPGPRWTTQEKCPSHVPVYPEIQEYESRRGRGEGAASEGPAAAEEADEVDEGVGGTPEYLCDTGDEGSVLSADIHTSSTSLWSADARDEPRAPKTPDASTGESGISVMKSEDEEEEEEAAAARSEEEVHSVTDSMVAEALAALEAATAGEDCE